MTSVDISNSSFALALRGRFVAVRDWLETLPLWVIQFLMRIAVASVFIKSGMLKLNSWEFAIKLFEEEYKVPLLDPTVAAALATFNELVFPIFLYLGLATRLATLPLLGMVLVIQMFVYPQAWTEHLMWASMLLLLLEYGPGKLSLDHWIERWFAGRPRP